LLPVVVMCVSEVVGPKTFLWV